MIKQQWYWRKKNYYRKWKWGKQYGSACETILRFFKFKIHHQSLSVPRLSIYLPNPQEIVLREHVILQILILNIEYEDNKLTAWIKINEHDFEVRDLTYVQFPSKYAWNKRQNIWTKQKIGLVDTLNTLLS